MTRIIGEPADREYDYEFTLVKRLSKNMYEFVAYFENYSNELESLAKQSPDYVVIHNIRISHKEKRESF